MSIKRSLTEYEIEEILEFIKPQHGIPHDTAISIVENNKKLLREQLASQQIYPEMIPELKKMIEDQYESSKVQPGESVGVISAQSIGEKQTQSTLNSVDWEEKLIYTKDNRMVVQPIGEMIDDLLKQHPSDITHIKENRTEYLELEDGYMVPSTDENGNVAWYKIEAVTRHLPVGKLVKVITQSGRSVMATQSKSFLVWDGKKFEGVLGSEVKVGDFLPTTHTLPRPKVVHTHFDIQTIFPKDKYLYTTEIHKALVFQKEYGGLQNRNNFAKHNGTTFTVPYNRYDTMMGKRKEYFTTCKPGLVYIHTSNGFVSHIPDKIPLDNDFGFFVGLYLSEGWCTKTFVGISNNDEAIRKRITDYCDRYGVTYHLVTSKGKNVRQGISNDLKIHSTLLARMFKIICDTGSANKRVPEFAYTAPVEFIKGLIDGYYSGDGCVKRDGGINASSVSEDLILGISSLLSYFGIFGRLSNHLQKKNNVGSKNIKRAYELNISNGFAQQFAREIPLTEAKKQDRLQNITLEKKYRYAKGKSQKVFPDRDVYFDEVVSVEYVEGTTEYVYDLTVAVTRNFQLWNGLQQVDTFHKAGSNEKTVTTGVPRVEELLNATKDPKAVNCLVYMKEPHESIEKLRETIGHKVVEITFEKISKSYDICIDKTEEKWYEPYRIIYGDDFTKYSDCISLKIDMDILYEYKLDLEMISKIISEKYSDMVCVFSPDSIGQLDVFVDTTNIDLPENRLVFITSENAKEIYLEEVVQPILYKIIICGIPNIFNIYFNDDHNSFETDGSNFEKLLGLSFVDETKTISNNVWDIYQTLGIEAAREFLIEECMEIMSGINKCHIQLLVEKMTYNGTISSISRYTMRNEECGPMGKASFEETMDNFLKAGVYGQEETTNGVSASIICGKISQVGSGLCDLKIDLKDLPENVSNNNSKQPKDTTITFEKMKTKLIRKRNKQNNNQKDEGIQQMSYLDF
jgi:intein/homing endonuclease